MKFGPWLLITSPVQFCRYNFIRVGPGNKRLIYAQLLLEIEADLDMSKYSDSLMDRVTIGTITACCTYLLLAVESHFEVCF